MNCKLLLIEWEDSQLGFHGWKFIDEQSFEVPVVWSVGFLVYEDKNYKVLYPHLHQAREKRGSGDILIPTSAIRKLTESPISFSFP